MRCRFFVVLLWLSAIQLYHAASAEHAAAPTRGAVGSLSTTDADVGAHAALTRTVEPSIKDPKRIRNLLQSEGDSVFECSLTTEQQQQYLTAAQRTWLVDDAVLEDIQNDLQEIINCSQEGDIILLNATQRIQPSARLIVPWRLTLSAYVEDTTLKNGAVRRSSNPVTITCPRENEGVFLAREGVLLANLVFEDCMFDAADAAGAIVEVEACRSPDASNAVELHHVNFTENTLASAPGLRVDARSCSAVEMRDVNFVRNACGGGVCGARLSSANALKKVRMVGNRPIEPLVTEPVMLLAPPESETTAIRLRAEDNRVAILNVTNGALNLTRSRFSQNAVTQPETAGALASLIYLSGARVLVERCRFESNGGSAGAVIHARSAEISVRDSHFERNSASTNGGCFVLSDSSSLVLEDSTLASNHASNGGAVHLTNASLEAKRCSFVNNTASASGGSVYTTAEANVTIEYCEFSAGDADLGGILRLSESSGEIRHSSILNSAAVRFGGGLLVRANSSLVATNLTAKGNSAGISGGAFALYSGSIADIQHSVCSRNTAAVGGGCLLVSGASTRVRDTDMVNNEARFGGALNAFSTSSATLINCRLSKNTARSGGGSVYVATSEFTVRQSRFTKGRAETGGELFALDGSSVEVTDSSFERGSSNGGGCIYSDTGTTVILNSTTFDRCEATDSVENRGSGGAILAQASKLEMINTAISKGTAFFGGAVSCTNRSVVTVSQSEFLKNSAISGGSWYLSRSSGNFTSCKFSEGSAETGGHFLVQGPAQLTIQHSSLEQGSASDDAGCVRLKTDSTAQMQNVTFKDCRAQEDGGALSITASEAIFSNCTFRSNSAGSDGGAIHSRQSDVSGRQLVFEQNSAGVNGGGFMGRTRNTVNLTNCRFADNSAQWGGAIELDDRSEGRFSLVTFFNNTARQTGGAVFIETSETRLDDCTFKMNSATNGGCLGSDDSVLQIRDSQFENAMAKKRGGVVAAERGSMLIENATMGFGSADYGGALSIERTEMTARGLRVTNCDAQRDGGAVFGNSSTILCADCRFESNVAEERGGAISFESRQPQELALQIDRSEVRNNTGEYGGGLHFVGPDIDVNCSLSDANCTYGALRETVFVGNQAHQAGGAVFSTDLTALLIDCETEIGDAELQFLGREQWEAMTRLNSQDSVCQSWSNGANAYGVDLASYGRFVQTTAEYEEPDNRIEIVQGNKYEIQEHRSGSPLPSFRLRVVDELGQGPAIGINSDTIEAWLSSPDDFFLGRVNIDLVDGNGLFSGVAGYQTPGPYQLQISFSDASLTPVEITVHIRECIIGEEGVQEGRLCRECASDMYSFVSNSGCVACPDDARCDEKAIRPEDGYWHASPCSRHVHRCVTRGACEFDGRDQDLREIVRQVETCDHNATLTAIYEDAQCKKGYHGPLCGACDGGYGRSRSFACQKCLVGAGSLALILVSIGVLTLLAIFPIRSNLASVRLNRIKMRTKRYKGKQTARQVNPTTPGPSHAMNIEMEERLSTGHLGASHNPSPTPLLTDEEKAELVDNARFKLTELFKITMNYVQVTAFAVSMNVEWTAEAIYVFQAAGYVSGVTTEAVSLSVDCMIGDGWSVEKSILTAATDCMVPVAVIGLLVLFWVLALGRAAGADRMTRLAQRIALSATAVLYVSFISITRSLLNILNCVSVHDSVDVGSDAKTSYWAADTSIQCYEGNHVVLAAVLGWPFLILFSIAFPIVAGYTIVKNVHARDYKKGWIYEVSGFMYRSYRPGHVFWETVVMLRKALLAVVVVFAYPLGSNLQSVLAVFVLALALYFHTLCRPYRQDYVELNELEGISILVSLLTFVSSLFFTDGAVSAIMRALITVGVVLCNCVLFLFFLFQLLIFAAAHFRLRLDQAGVDYDPAGGTLHILKIYAVDHIWGNVLEALGRIGSATVRPFTNFAQRRALRRGRQLPQLHT